MVGHVSINSMLLSIGTRPSNLVMPAGASLVFGLEDWRGIEQAEG
jgi:hypothetical protein